MAEDIRDKYLHYDLCLGAAKGMVINMNTEMDIELEEWEMVVEAGSRLQAEIIRGFLEATGFLVRLEGEAIGAIYGLQTGPLAEVKVFVPKGQAAEAKELLLNQVPQEQEDF
jgi:hypothetical protein